MKANEFVEKFGIKSALEILKNAPVSATSYRISENNQLGLGGLYGRIENINGCILSLCDLKQIVDAWELVGVYGGLELAKEFISEYSSFPFRGNLVKAINLVEQCNASD